MAMSKDGDEMLKATFYAYYMNKLKSSVLPTTTRKSTQRKRGKKEWNIIQQSTTTRKKDLKGLSWAGALQ